MRPHVKPGVRRHINVHWNSLDYKPRSRAWAAATSCPNARYRGSNSCSCCRRSGRNCASRLEILKLRCLWRQRCAIRRRGHTMGHGPRRAGLRVGHAGGAGCRAVAASAKRVLDSCRRMCMRCGHRHGPCSCNCKSHRLSSVRRSAGGARGCSCSGAARCAAVGSATCAAARV
jgi:hypothetical protein